MSKVQEHKEVCVDYAMGKNSRSSFPKGQAWRAFYTLQLVHSDICGPMQTPSIGKNFYFLTFIDDYSRMCWIYFLKTKDEAFTYFKEFKNNVKNIVAII